MINLIYHLATALTFNTFSAASVLPNLAHRESVYSLDPAESRHPTHVLSARDFGQPMLQTSKYQKGRVSGRFIVEFKDEAVSALNSKAAKQGIGRHENEGNDHSIVSVFTGMLNDAGYKDATPVVTFDEPSIFNGASFSLKSEDDGKTLEFLKSLPEVKNAWPVTFIDLMTENLPLVETDNGPAPHLSKSLAGDLRWSPHALTGVDKLHDRGLSGKGVTVGVIDTGTFYYHPALGSGFGPGKKVEGGWNFVGNQYDYKDNGEAATPNGDPLDCNGHGTHVAGIIAGSNNTHFVGVAPNAIIRSYKIFGCRGGATNENIIGALLRAYNDGCDIFSLSLGSSGDMYQDNPEAQVVDKLVNNGVFAAVAAGNSGSEGSFFGSGLATGKHITTVGSTTSGQLIGYRAYAQASSGDVFNFTYVSVPGVQPSKTGTFVLQQYYDTACNMARFIPKSVNSGSILFPQGNCTGNDFFHAVHGLGYSVALNYINSSDPFSYMAPAGNFETQQLIRGTTDDRLAKWIQEEQLKNHSVSLVFDETSLVPQMVLQQGGKVRISPFSSWGPDYSGNLYPHIVAPGSDIYSTFKNNSYAMLSGTSMATPYISGVAALFIEAFRNQHKNASTADLGKFIRRRMIQTASLLTSSFERIETGKTAALIQQGAGMINAVNLIDSKTIITSDEILELGVGRNLSKSFVVTIRNNNHEPILYNLSHIPAPTVLTQRPNSLVFTLYPPLLYDHANITFDNILITVGAKSEQNVTVSISIPESVWVKYAPVYQGVLAVRGSNGEDLVVPYTGMLADKFSIWGPDMKPVILQQNQTTGNMELYNATKQRINVYNDGQTALVMNLNTGARVLNGYLVNEAFDEKKLVFFKGNMSNSPGIVTPLRGFPINKLARIPNGISLGVRLPDNVTVPDGRYRIFLSGLPAVPKIEAYESKFRDWEIHTTEWFNWSTNSTVSETISINGSTNLTVFNPYSQVALETNSDGSNTTESKPRFGITAVDVSSLSSNQSSYLSPFDTFEVSLTLDASEGLFVGDESYMQMPREFFTFPDPFPVYNSVGDAVVNISFPEIDGERYCKAEVIKTWNVSSVIGGVYFTTFLRNPEQYGRQFLPLTFKNKENRMFAEVLSLSSKDEYFLGANVGLSKVYIFVPEEFQEWDQLNVKLEFAYEVDCLDVKIDSGLGTRNSIEHIDFAVDCKSAARQIDIKLDKNPGFGPYATVQVGVKSPSVVKNSPVNAFMWATANGTAFEHRTTVYINNVNLKSTGLNLGTK